VGIGALVVETEDDMTKLNFLKIWSVMVGGMDALTGLLLIVTPATVLRLLQIEAPGADALVYLSWIGVFVLAVGLSYGLALGKHRGRGETVWMFTALARMLVAVFLITQITLKNMAPAWIVVALSDGVVAAVQMIILRKNWWREALR
jgi:Na+-driven multidrug efflux pump